MRFYEYDDNLVLVRSFEGSIYDPMKMNTTAIAPPPVPEGKVAQWAGNEWLIRDPVINGEPLSGSISTTQIERSTDV